MCHYKLHGLIWIGTRATRTLFSAAFYRVIKISLCTWFFSLGCVENLSAFEQSPHTLWFEDGHHRIRSEYGPCYTEHGLRKHSSECQQMSADWRGTLCSLFVAFCIVIIRRTENFYHPVSGKLHICSTYHHGHTSNTLARDSSKKLNNLDL
jgi:hypothetical protein